MTTEQKADGYARRNRAHRKILNASVIPNSLKLTILTIIAQLNGETGCQLAWPSAQFIADKLGLKKRMIQYHLKTIRQLRIFDIRYLKPKEAIAYGKEKYGITLRLNASKRQAPPLYEVNGHDLWSKCTRLSKESLEEFLKVITPSEKVMQPIALLSNATDCIQQKEKENAILSSPFPLASTSPFFSDENKGTAEGSPGRVYAVTTTGASSCCYAPANDGHHLPTHRQIVDHGIDSGKELLLSPQADSGSRPLVSPLSESKTQGAEGGSPGSFCFEPEEIELEAQFEYPEPEERDPAPTGYASVAQEGISEFTEGIETCSVPPPVQKKEEREKEALSGHEILMRASEERETRRRRMVP